MRQQVTADHLTGSERQDLVGEQSDIDRLHGTPELELRDRRKQGSPSPSVNNVHDQIGYYLERDPLPIERAEIPGERPEIVAVEHPGEARRGNGITKHL